jgi:hypothetical protein
MTESAELGTAPDAGHGQRLMLDVREVRDRMRLRLLASLPAFLGGAWLVWIADSLLLRILAVAGLVFATVWVGLARRSIEQVARAGRHYLDIGTTGFTIHAGAQESYLAWSDIEAVEIDEDRLVVRLRVRGAAPLAVEPQYGGLGLRELAQTIERGRSRSVAGSLPAPGVRLPQS